jgi:Zn-dependent metalloprotease
MNVARTGLMAARFLLGISLMLVFPARAQDVKLTTRPVRGVVKFTNTNLEILNRLGPPGNQGVTSLSLRADSLPPRAGISAFTVPPVVDKLENPYALVLQAGTNEATAISYSLQPTLYLDDDREMIYFRPVKIPALVAGETPVTVDLPECVGLVELRFVNAAGEPVPVDDATGYATADTSAYLYSTPAGSTSAHLVVPAGADLTFVLQVRRGTNRYENQLTDTFTLVTNVPCDAVVTLDLVLRGAADLGRIVGNVDVQGEFEWTTEAVESQGLLGRTAVFANGPAGNRRLDFVAGDNEAKPASGPFELENLLPSDVEMPPLGWQVWAEMHFRAHRRFEYFVTPQLAHGLVNPGVTVAAGATVDLGDTFVLKPAFLSGAVVLAGPPDTEASKSALRGVQRPDDFFGLDSHGIPNFTGASGINQSYVAASGVDRLAGGATLTASGGQAYAAFPGSFNPATGAFEGDYELVVGGLKGEASIWRQDVFRLALYTPDLPGVPYVNQGLTIIEKPAVEHELVPGQLAVQAVRYGLSEVCIRFRSAARPFYSPRVQTGSGVFDGTDFAGRVRRYETYVDGAFGPPLTREQAGLEGRVTLYLPQGTHTLPPFVTVLNEDGSESTTGLNPIQLTVGAQQRLCVEACLQVEASLVLCSAEGPGRVTGRVKTCGQAVRRVSYRLNGGEETTVCSDCGVNPDFSLELALPPGSEATNVIEVIARDGNGGESFLTGTLTRDTTPPVLQCPGNLFVTTGDPAGARVDFTVAGADDRGGPVSLVSVPASGSVFPFGTNVVTTTAADACGNKASCTFEVIVTPPAQECFTVTIVPPDCTGSFGFRARADATSSCGAILTNLSLQASPVGRPEIRLGHSETRILDGARDGLTTAHGLFPEFDGFEREFYRNILYTATAIDAEGRIAVAQLVASGDTTPPVINCPADLVVPRSTPCGARPFFEVTATDDCSIYRDGISIVCEPPAGSLFPVGETAVKCTATDFMGNRSQCSFKVTVTAGDELPAPVVTEVTPATIANAGDLVTVRGANFTQDDEVLIDGEALQLAFIVSATEFSGYAPALANGSHTVTVRRCGRVVAELANACATGTLPRIFATEPAAAFARGGSLISVTGTNLTAETQVRVAFPAAGNENLLRNLSVSADGTLITGEVPPLPENEFLGARTVIVFDARGEDLLPNGVNYLPNPTETDPQVVGLRQLQVDSTEPLDLTWRNGFPGGLTARVRVTGDTPEARSRSFVRRYRELLRIQNPDAELELKGVTRENLDDVRLGQNYGGVPVFGAEIVVTLSGDEVVALTGNLLPLAELAASGFNLLPTLTPEQAAETARQDQGIRFPLSALEPAAELVIYDERLFTDAPLDSHLAWKVKLKFAAHEVVVDAHTGAIVARLAAEHSHRFDLDIQDAEGEANATDDDCFNTSDDVDVADEDDFNSDYNNDLDAVLANRFARDCWNYFNHHFGWESYDDDDGQLEIFIHTTINPRSVASWNSGCGTIQFADGAVEYEVMVHEFTHAIISETSRLQYRFQSGALNEHFSDAMAVIADRERGELENPGQPINWLLGENRRAPQPTTAFRDFQNPANPLGGQPDRMANYRVLPLTNDFAGVHSNSGIPNRAAYLMIEGGSFQGFQVQGIGADKVRHVLFEAMRNLPVNASFADARAREIATAEDFVRRNARGFLNRDVCAIRNAWASVGVGRGDSDCDGREDDLHDLDNDLIPNALDNCPRTANPAQEDVDRDRKGDVCDNCRMNFNPGQEDMDNDRIGDVCDPDRDGDGCLNTVDQHPDSTVAIVGSEKRVNCSQSTTPHYKSESGDTDRDGTRDCEDLDDDNDDIPDSQDPCPAGSLGGIPGQECTVFGKECPVIAKDWFFTCLGGGCVEYYVRVTDRINPDPTRDVVFDRVNLLKNTLYFAPDLGSSLAQTANRLAGIRRLGSAGGARADVPVMELRRVELWRRPTGGEPARLIAVVGEFDPATLEVGQTRQGTFLAFTPPSGTNAPTLSSVWHVGEDPAVASRDTDGDGLPDGWERQHGLNPADPADATADSDGDGLNNADEFASGADPQSVVSNFDVKQIQRTATGVRVRFAAPAGRRCQLERTGSLTQPNWQPVGSPHVMHSDIAELTDPSMTAEQAFFRVRLLDL